MAIDNMNASYSYDEARRDAQAKQARRAGVRGATIPEAWGDKVERGEKKKKK